jgi:hypothetical protein
MMVNSLPAGFAAPQQIPPTSPHQQAIAAAIINPAGHGILPIGQTTASSELLSAFECPVCLGLLNGQLPLSKLIFVHQITCFHHIYNANLVIWFAGIVDPKFRHAQLVEDRCQVFVTWAWKRSPQSRTLNIVNN